MPTLPTPKVVGSVKWAALLDELVLLDAGPPHSYYVGIGALPPMPMLAVEEVVMIHPAVESYVRSQRDQPNPHPATVSAAERRSTYRRNAQAMQGELTAVAESADVELELNDRVLGARLYTPVGDEGRALIIYFHGGSFVVGDLDTHDALCRRLSNDTRMRILAVSYRLAPEHPFPAGINDAVDALRLVAAQRTRFAHADVQIVVMGDSAGATMAAVAAALTRHENLGVAAQVLIYPTLGPELLTNSAHEFATGFLLEVEHLRFDYEQYLGEWRDHTDPRISPLFFDDLTESPEAIVLVAGCDPLRDEGVAYAGLLEHFDVPVEILEAVGMPHGFLRLGGLFPEALRIVDDLAAHLHRCVKSAS